MGKFLGWGVLSPTVPIYVTVSFIRLVVALCACPYLEGSVAMSSIRKLLAIGCWRLVTVA